MSKQSTQKISLAEIEYIPLDKLEIHEDNVRKSEVDEEGIAELAADIAARGLLQSLSIRPILDDADAKTGRYGIQAGSRRFRALKLLLKQKKLAKNTPVPCIVKRDGYAEADSLAENTQRQALKPLDEFRAYKSMADKGHGEQTTAAAHRVSVQRVRQCLRLANASPVILNAYEEEQITLEQLQAYCVTDNHARQEQVFEVASHYYNKGRPEQIRHLLTEKSVASNDRRALFIGADAYAADGGVIERDLFSEEDEGYLVDTDLVYRLVTEKLAAEAQTVKAEGWGWVEHAFEFPWNHHREFRSIKPVEPALSEAEEEEYRQLSDERDELEYNDGDELTEEAEARVAAINTKLEEFDARIPIYSDEQMAKAGAFVSLDEDGKLSVERGYRRYAELVEEQRQAVANGAAASSNDTAADDFISDHVVVVHVGDQGNQAPIDDDSAELPDKLLTELTAYHSLGLGNAVAGNYRIAFLAILNALVLDLFYLGHTSNNCLQIVARRDLPATGGIQALAEFKARKEIDARHEAFEKQLPDNEADLWAALLNLDDETLQSLFAHCAGLSINALHETWGRSNKRRHALQLAEAVALDMGGQGFVTTAANYLGRIKKQQILETVTDAIDRETADLLADHKKKDMAAEAERLLAGTGWLPEALRTPEPLEETAEETLPAFLDEPELQAAE